MVVGGSGLLAIGAVERATRDVDVVALRNADGLRNPDPLPAALQAARERVARDFSLPPKLYALVDQGPGKHEEDLRSLGPTVNELRAAARWSRSQDPSEGFEQILRQTLSHLGVDDVDLGT